MIVHNQILIFCLLTLFCAVGCVHDRLSMMVDVKDCGQQIETKNRYALKFNGAPRDNEWLADLQKSQPKVFDADGIPVEISGDGWLRTKSVANGFTWTGVFAPLLVLPVMVSGNEQKSTYIVDVVDNPDAHATVTVKVKDDTAFCLLSPLPMLCVVAGLVCRTRNVLSPRSSSSVLPVWERRSSPRHLLTSSSTTSL